MHRWAAILLCAWLCGCAARQPMPEPSTPWAYVAARDDAAAPFDAYAPVVVPGNPQQIHNRIGMAAARLLQDGRERIYVDVRESVYYYQRQTFSTARGAYTNLIYRVHFTRVPHRWFPFNLTAGKNVGLIFVVTLDDRERPVLVTTVHTCGCYVAFVPTTYLPADAYPPGWNMQGQRVLGESLPGLLEFPRGFDTRWRLLIRLRDQTHRVMDIRVADVTRIGESHRVKPIRLAPIQDLKRLSLDGATTSFYETRGPRRGLVKQPRKKYEMLLMSWWTLDLNVGADKELGDPAETGTIFYTSLKPWRRADSNMWDFPRFLRYWKWGL